jgi:hypothetical protein
MRGLFWLFGATENLINFIPIAFRPVNGQDAGFCFSGAVGFEVGGLMKRQEKVVEKFQNFLQFIFF